MIAGRIPPVLDQAIWHSYQMSFFLDGKLRTNLESKEYLCDSVGFSFSEAEDYLYELCKDLQRRVDAVSRSKTSASTN